ncbi:MAG: ATP-binding protein [Myxococcaceae bacterium]
MKPSTTPVKLVELDGSDGSSAELLELFDALHVAVLRVNPPELRVSFVGQRCQSLLGELTRLAGGNFWSSLVPKTELPQLLHALGEVATDGKSRTLEHRARLPNRPDAWLRTSIIRSKSELLVALVDITAERENERQWHEIESWLVTLGETLPFDFWICDRDGRCMLLNPAAMKRVGNVVGTRVEEWQPSIARALNGETTRQELTLPIDGKNRRLVRVVSPVIRDSEVQGALGVDLDVTPLKETEERLRASMHELAEAQDALVRKQRLAALGEMAAVIAHEIRNPLGALANSAALLSREAKLSDDAKELCRIIADEVGRLDRLVVALLDLARPLNLKLAAIALEHAVDDALTHTLMTEGAKDRVRVHREVQKDLGPVHADGLLFQLALGNVLRNAVQAMPNGGELKVALSSEARYAVVKITDTGGGIPERIRGKLFQPFVTTRPTGSGLGLAIVKRIIEEHGGDVALQSDAPRGSTCVIRIPAMENL